MRYWWVNHKQTVRQEVDGGFLWSPFHEANDSRSQFYENMRIAEPGDRVVSFAATLIRFVGTIVGFARVAPRPPEFRELGKQWSEVGWLLPVSWTPLKEPIRPRDLLHEIRPFLPKKYSPIQADTGNGNQKAYLAEINSELFNLLITSDLQYGTSESGSNEFDALIRVDEGLQSSICNNDSFDRTTKEQLILARYGQGKFRASVLARYKRCLITGVEAPTLLVASHIKPWRACASAEERLDGANGLLLAPHADRLFDRGLITVENNSKIRLSSKLNADDVRRLGIANALTRPVASLPEESRKYLAFHQEKVFLG